MDRHVVLGPVRTGRSPALGAATWARSDLNHQSLLLFSTVPYKKRKLLRNEAVPNNNGCDLLNLLTPARPRLLQPISDLFYACHASVTLEINVLLVNDHHSAGKRAQDGRISIAKPAPNLHLFQLPALTERPRRALFLALSDTSPPISTRFTP